MFKKILCLAMVLVMVAGMAVIGVSAAELEDNKLYFQVPDDWNNYKYIYCHIWPYGEEPLANWQQKKERCDQVEDRLYSYDPTKVGGLTDGVTYCVIFSADTGIQTYDALMSTACYGDVLYCNGVTFENPEDSSKTALAAVWKNNTAYGPVLAISSIGNVVGSTAAESAEALFTDFITGPKLDNARIYSNKDDQTLIDDTASALGLGQDTIEKLITEAGVEIAWTKAESAAPEADDTSVVVPSVSGTVSTGQEMTIVYISIVMMIASAGVIFFARKKRVTE